MTFFVPPCHPLLGLANTHLCFLTYSCLSLSLSLPPPPPPPDCSPRTSTDGKYKDLLKRGALHVQDWYANICYTTCSRTGDKFSTTDIRLEGESVQIQKILALMNLAIYATGGGVARQEEVFRLTIDRTKWSSMGWVHYTLESRKKGSLLARRGKIRTRRITPELSRILVVVRQVCILMKKPGVDGELLPRLDGSYGIPQAMAELMGIEGQAPRMTDIRQALTSFFNIRLPYVQSLDYLPSVVSHPFVSQRCHHSQMTATNSYPTLLSDAEDLLLADMLDALGAPPNQGYSAEISPQFSPAQLLQALRKIHGPSAGWTCCLQERAAHVYTNHRFTNHADMTPPGFGKTTSVALPRIVGQLFGMEIGMIIFVVPYRSLVAHIAESFRKLLLRFQSSRVSSDGDGSNDDDSEFWVEPYEPHQFAHTVPPEWQGSCPPDFAVMSINTMSALADNFPHVLNRMANAGLIHSIVVDEVQQVIEENRFRPEWDTAMRGISTLQVPTTLLLGTGILSIAKDLARHWNLNGTPKHPVDFDYIGGAGEVDPIGTGFPIACVETDDTTTGAVCCALERVGERSHVQIVCDVKARAMEVADRLRSVVGTHYRVEVLTGDMDAKEKERIATAWVNGKIHILANTTCHLTGSENPFLKTLLQAGLLFNMSNTIQGFKRIRPPQAVGALAVLFVEPRMLKVTKASVEEAKRRTDALYDVGLLKETPPRDYEALFSECSLIESITTEGCFRNKMRSALHFNAHGDCGLCSGCDKLHGTTAARVDVDRSIEATMTARLNGELSPFLIAYLTRHHLPTLISIFCRPC